MTIEELNERLDYWQRLLRLQDWRVHASIVRAYSLNPDQVGESTITRSLKHSKMRLLDPIDYDPEWATPEDMENTLIHELLHLHLHDWETEKGTLVYDEKEQVIDLLAGALLNLERR